jgi:hypothetical protein
MPVFKIQVKSIFLPIVVTFLWNFPIKILYVNPRNEFLICDLDHTDTSTISETFHISVRVFQTESSTAKSDSIMGKWKVKSYSSMMDKMVSFTPRKLYPGEGASGSHSVGC